MPCPELQSEGCPSLSTGLYSMSIKNFLCSCISGWFSPWWMLGRWLQSRNEKLPRCFLGSLISCWALREASPRRWVLICPPPLLPISGLPQHLPFMRLNSIWGSQNWIPRHMHLLVNLIRQVFDPGLLRTFTAVEIKVPLEPRVGIRPFLTSWSSSLRLEMRSPPEFSEKIRVNEWDLRWFFFSFLFSIFCWWLLLRSMYSADWKTQL